jgi:hypothetical protein
MTVVSAGMLARRYSAPSIALALCLCLLTGLSDGGVHAQVGAWQLRGRSARGWAQLYRWRDRSAQLFALPSPLSGPDDPNACAPRVLTVRIKSRELVLTPTAA